MHNILDLRDTYRKEESDQEKGLLVYKKFNFFEKTLEKILQ